MAQRDNSLCSEYGDEASRDSFPQMPEVDLARATVTLLVTKNGEKRTIPLNKVALELLKARSKIRHLSGYVFASALTPTSIREISSGHSIRQGKKLVLRIQVS